MSFIVAAAPGIQDPVQPPLRPAIDSKCLGIPLPPPNTVSPTLFIRGFPDLAGSLPLLPGQQRVQTEKRDHEGRHEPHNHYKRRKLRQNHHNQRLYFSVLSGPSLLTASFPDLHRLDVSFCRATLPTRVHHTSSPSTQSAKSSVRLRWSSPSQPFSFYSGNFSSSRDITVSGGSNCPSSKTRSHLSF